MARVTKRHDRPNGGYFLDFRDENGRRRRVKANTNSKRHAMEIWQIQLGEVAKGEFARNREMGRTPFRQLAEEYLAIEVPALRWGRHVRTIVGYWVAFLGDRRLRDITVKDIAEYRAGRLGQIKPATLNRELAVVRRMFNVAISWELADRNPASHMKRLPERNMRLRFLTSEEAGRLVAAAVPHLRPILLVALNTGARLSELLTLKWTEVDFASGTVSFLDTKSGRRRDVRMNRIVEETIGEMERTSDAVFTYNGKAIRSVKTAFRTARARAGIAADFRFHDMRHTFASHAVMAGVDLRTLQEILGHQSYQMTLRYAHLAKDHVMKAVHSVSLGAPEVVGEKIIPFIAR